MMRYFHLLWQAQIDLYTTITKNSADKKCGNTPEADAFTSFGRVCENHSFAQKLSKRIEIRHFQL